MIEDIEEIKKEIDIATENLKQVEKRYELNIQNEMNLTAEEKNNNLANQKAALLSNEKREINRERVALLSKIDGLKRAIRRIESNEKKSLSV